MNAEEVRVLRSNLRVILRMRDGYLSLSHWGMFPVEEWQIASLGHK